MANCLASCCCTWRSWQGDVLALCNHVHYNHIFFTWLQSSLEQVFLVKIILVWHLCVSRRLVIRLITSINNHIQLIVSYTILEQHHYFWLTLCNLHHYFTLPSYEISLLASLHTQIQRSIGIYALLQWLLRASCITEWMLLVVGGKDWWWC